MRYEYYEAVKADIKEAIGYGDYDYIIVEHEHENVYGDDIYNALYDAMWIDDSITGNASGTYTFNTWEAEENLCHNLELVKEAYEEFGCEPDFENPESMDVTIRCYLLGSALQEVMEGMGL